MKCFDAFRLDPVNHCLWRGVDRVPMTPKAFDLLRYLVDHADRLVTHDEILEALWTDAYVNSEVVKKYILAIRKALGDRSGQRTFIETVPRRGYRFVAPVRDADPGVPSGSSVRAARTVVGQGVPRARLEDCLRHAALGVRQVVFVTGEAGIGKTTLVDAFHQDAGGRPSVRVARG